jgi:uncharacterized damage-inducible protein DinB
VAGQWNGPGRVRKHEQAVVGRAPRVRAVATGDQPAGEQVPTRWTRATVFDDMWVDPADDPREDGAPVVDERSLLNEYLRTQRLTLRMKCADLGADGLAARSVPPSTMSLLGLVRHMTEVERSWSRRVMAGEDAPRRYLTVGDPDGDWNGAVADDAVVDEAWAAWREEQEFTDRLVASLPDLGISREVGDGRRISLREVLLHLIEEYARHNGHADLLRERVDGRVGQ